jgi:hypothetical protein
MYPHTIRFLETFPHTARLKRIQEVQEALRERQPVVLQELLEMTDMLAAEEYSL